MKSKDRLAEFPNPFKAFFTTSQKTNFSSETRPPRLLRGLIPSPADPEFDAFMKYIGRPGFRNPK